MLEKSKGIPSAKGYYVAGSGERFRYDSMTELAMMMHLDTCDVAWRKNTRLRIPYVFEGTERNYVPDFLVDGNRYLPPLIMEIKGREEPEVESKSEAAKEYCRKNGMSYSLVPYANVRKLVDWDEVKRYHDEHKGAKR